MAIFNNYPATYQNPYLIQQPQFNQPVQQPQQQSPIIWVSGEAGAKSFLISPNTSVVLFDSEGSSIYIKSADASGMPSLKILDYTIRDTAQNASPVVPKESVSYATKDDLKAVYAQIAALESKLKGEDDHA